MARARAVEINFPIYLQKGFADKKNTIGVGPLIIGQHIRPYLTIGGGGYYPLTYLHIVALYDGVLG